MFNRWACVMLRTLLLPPREEGSVPLMRSMVIALVMLALSPVAALSQTGHAAPTATVASVEAGKQKAYAAAIADCEDMWDRGTHMTRKDWSRTCQRVQIRLQQLELR
jgi:hypothetical protein